MGHITDGAGVLLRTWPRGKIHVTSLVKTALEAVAGLTQLWRTSSYLLNVKTFAGFNYEL